MGLFDRRLVRVVLDHHCVEHAIGAIDEMHAI